MDRGGGPGEPQSLAARRALRNHLKRSRRRADLSQQALADLVGMNRVNVSELERGLALPRIDTILKLATGSNVSTCELLEGMEWRPGRHVHPSRRQALPGEAQEAAGRGSTDAGTAVGIWLRRST